MQISGHVINGSCRAGMSRPWCVARIVISARENTEHTVTTPVSKTLSLAQCVVRYDGGRGPMTALSVSAEECVVAGTQVFGRTPVLAFHCTFSHMTPVFVV